MSRSAGVDRGNSKYLQWRSNKKDVLIYIKTGNWRRAKQLLKIMIKNCTQYREEMIEGKNKYG